MKFNEYCMKIVFVMILTLIFYFQTYSVYGIEKENQSNNNNKQLVQSLQNYWQWWGNSPEDSPDNNPKCSIHIDTNNSIVFLQNPFETGNASYDCTENPIPYGYLIFFPLLSSWCSQGDVGLFDKSYNEIKNCAFNLQRGTIHGKILFDDKEIVNMFIDNSNGIDMQKKKKVVNNLPQNQYYKEIFSEEFVDILATSNTTMANNWEKDDYKRNPIYYNAVMYCDCILIDTTELKIGPHDLHYTISAKADPPSPTLIADRWDFTSNTNYKLVIQ
jgi:hypothetical protein